jgi:putative hydrolase of the HAD superfamily
MSLITGVRGVAFDAVGTLIHPEPSAALIYAQVGHLLGSHHDGPEICGRFGNAFRRQEAIDQAAGWRTSEEREWQRWQDIVREVLDDVTEPDRCFEVLYDHFARPTSWRCDPTAGGLFEHLGNRGIKVAIASNFDHRLRSVTAGMPELASLPIIISSEVGWRKPARPYFEAVAQALSVSMEQLLIVGDDVVNDVDGALAAGCQALRYDPVRGTLGGPGNLQQLNHLIELIDV